MPEQEPLKHTRRTFLRRAAVGAAGFVLLDQIPRVPEMIDSRSEIIFDAQESQRATETRSACIVFGGASFRSAEPITNWIKPAVSPLGGVGSVRYANDGVDPKSLAEEMLRLRASGIENISFYLSSMGTHVAGKTMRVLETLGEDIPIKNIMIDCTPPSMDYLDNPTLATAVNGLPTNGTLNAVANLLVHRRPFAESAATPSLWDEQLQVLNEGEEHIYPLAKAARRHGSNVLLLTPADPEKDTLVDAPASQKRLIELFPTMHVYPVGGEKQQHGIYPQNIEDYHDAIEKFINDTVTAALTNK